MQNEKFMERNRKRLRITEIPPGGEYEKIKCPFCDTSFEMRIGKNAKCDNVTVVCKRCKRILLLNEPMTGS